ncbi:pantoate-beta-alanine ligase [Polytolypa hystricis UAMH7299]|uniref:Pantoate--beta-alanine ligase n=1 Tax=Polytolypa hystricis (strain UAMH7299) TaxID=1447883 RepID=A0A2B7YF95_POLH7|nr:pantoate-beta-alanine ligase [Polytolypa hystricis UAMH7299]
MFSLSFHSRTALLPAIRTSAVPMNWSLKKMNRWLRGFATLTPKFANGNAAGANPASTALTVFRDVPPLRQQRKQLLLSNRTVGLVPTMGALHEGHLSLIREAASENTDVIVSIYVNPTQFGVNEDLSAYPRTWTEDMQKLEALDRELELAASRNSGRSSQTSPPGRITAVFAPTSKVMYPSLPPTSEIDGYGTFVTITPLSLLLEGASRPVFFRGVATVCMKLFNIVTPDKVYFGQKDVQQTVIIKRMVKDLHLGTEVKVFPTVREQDGLALSSRNVFLGARRRKVGLVLYRALKEAENAFSSGKRSREDILGAANRLAEVTRREQETLPPSERVRFEVDYISLADPDSLEELDYVKDAEGAILSGAVKMLPLEDAQPGEDCGEGSGTISVRLIDNLILHPVQ